MGPRPIPSPAVPVSTAAAPAAAPASAPTTSVPADASAIAAERGGRTADLLDDRHVVGEIEPGQHHRTVAPFEERQVAGHEHHPLDRHVRRRVAGRTTGRDRDRDPASSSAPAARRDDVPHGGRYVPIAAIMLCRFMT